MPTSASLLSMKHAAIPQAVIEMVRNYQRKTPGLSAGREVEVRCEDRETVDVPLLAEVLIRIALRSTSAPAGQHELGKQRLGNAGLSRFFQDTLAVKQ